MADSAWGYSIPRIFTERAKHAECSKVLSLLRRGCVIDYHRTLGYSAWHEGITGGYARTSLAAILALADAVEQEGRR